MSHLLTDHQPQPSNLFQQTTVINRSSLRKLSQLWFTVLIFSSLNLSAQNPFIQHYNTSKGLPSDHVLCIFQDSEKFIWFGTSEGIIRFDGTITTNYTMKDGLNHNSVSWINEDAFGRIWFRCSEGGFNYFYQNKIYNKDNCSFLDSIPDYARPLVMDKESVVYFYITGRTKWLIWELDTVNRVKRYTITIPEEFNSSSNQYKRVMGIRKSTIGEFLIWTFPNGIFKIRNYYEKSEQIPNKCEFVSIFPTDGPTTYAASYNYKIHKEIIYKFYNEFLVDSIALNLNSCGYIQSILEDKNGMVWAATIDKGLFCIMNKMIVHHFDIKAAKSILQDHEGNIWIGSEYGAYKISPFFLYGKHYNKSLFQNKGIQELSANPEGGVWCSSGEAVYLLKNKEVYSLNLPGYRWEFNRIYGLINNGLLIEKGLNWYYALVGLEFKHVSKSINYAHVYEAPSRYSNMTFNKNETEFFAIAGSRIFKFSSPEKKFLIIDTVKINNILGAKNIFINVNNDLIVNSRLKNFIILNDSAVPYAEISSLDGKLIVNHIMINNNTDLYCTEDDSIYMVKDKKIVNLTSFFDCPVNIISGKIMYHEPTLYLPTLNNIYTCDNPLNVFGNKPVNLQLLDINFRNIHDIIFSNDKLYIASDDGLTAIPYSEIQAINTNTPIPYFQSIQINDKQEVVNNQGISLYGNNRISIVFGSINYSSNPVIYEYMLEGADKDWSTTTGTNVVFHDLHRGDYIFKLKARKPTSSWSEPVEYRITVNATFWQHPIFFAGISIIFIILVTIIIIWRKNVQMKNREIDHQLITLEQKALQSMMNPHFIFNALSSIQSYLLQNKSKEAGLYLSQFARLIRQNLSAINSPMVVLEEEIDRLKNYLDLERLRMSNKFNYNIKIDENVADDEVMIPSMILQPFVENAILHGISSLNDNGEILLAISMNSEKALTVVIEDNGIGMKCSNTNSVRSEKHLNMGMGMTRKRLQVIGKRFHVETSVEISEVSPGNPNPGTRVSIVVPVSYSNNKA